MIEATYPYTASRNTELPSPSNGLRVVPAVFMWGVALLSAFFFLHGILELTANNTTSGIAELHFVAKRIIVIHLIGTLLVSGVSFFGGCAWMSRRTRIAVVLSVSAFALAVGIILNILIPALT